MNESHQLEIEDVSISVIRKSIKNLYIRVRPPDGRVTISAPRRATTDAIHDFATSRLDWIRRHRTAIQARSREGSREYVDGELYSVWGLAMPLKVVQGDGRQRVECVSSVLHLHTRFGTSMEQRAEIVARWHRDLVKHAVSPLIEAWEPRLQVSVKGLSIRQMKTRWGSCSTKLGTIRLNTELAKNPKECLEYVVVHEMAHLLEASHGPQFRALMDEHLPSWRETRRVLNRLPIGLLGLKTRPPPRYERG